MRGHIYRFGQQPFRTILLGICLCLGATGCATYTPSTQPAARVSANIDAEVVAELNRARTNPGAYAMVIARRLKDYDGREGKRAIREAIEVLERTAPMPPLAHSDLVSLAARDHVRDQGKTARTGHGGSDGSDPFTRIRRYVDSRGAAENIAYGLYDARDIVVELIIDDGIPNRGHRVNILNPRYRIVGVATGPHDRYGIMCVMDFSVPFETTAAN